MDRQVLGNSSLAAGLKAEPTIFTAFWVKHLSKLFLKTCWRLSSALRLPSSKLHEPYNDS